MDLGSNFFSRKQEKLKFHTLNSRNFYSQFRIILHNVNTIIGRALKPPIAAKPLEASVEAACDNITVPVFGLMWCVGALPERGAGERSGPAAPSKVRSLRQASGLGIPQTCLQRSR